MMRQYSRLFGHCARYSRSDEAHGTSVVPRCVERNRAGDRRARRAPRGTRARSRGTRRAPARRAAASRPACRGRACCARRPCRTRSSSSAPPLRAVEPLFSALRTWLRTLRSSASHAARRVALERQLACPPCAGAPAGAASAVTVAELDVRQPALAAATAARPLDQRAARPRRPARTRRRS